MSPLSMMILAKQYQSVHKTWNNLEFDNLGKNNLEFEQFSKKPGILYKSYIKTWIFLFELFNNFDITNYKNLKFYR